VNIFPHRLQQPIDILVMLGASTLVVFGAVLLWSSRGHGQTTVSMSPMVVVIRCSEKQGTSHVIQDFRTSFLGIYERGSSDWNRVGTETFHVRSTSTAAGSPDNPLPGDVAGYVSVPAGLYTGERVEWPKREGTWALRLSDWHRTDGVISLPHPQTLYEWHLDNDQTVSRRMVRSGLEKRGTYLHPSHTRIWSRGDSYGCMNLYHPLEPAETASDWERFATLLEDHGIRAGGDRLLILVVPAGELGAIAGELPNHIESSVIESWKYRKEMVAHEIQARN
jgi:hypothetical protein